MEGKEGWKVITKILLEAEDLERGKEISKAERICRTTSASKDGQLAEIEKQLEELRKQLALLAKA